MRIGNVPIEAICGHKLDPNAGYLLRADWVGANQSFSDAQVLDSPSEGIPKGILTAIIKDGTLGISTNKLSATPQTAPFAWGDLALPSTNGYARASGLALIGHGLNIATLNKWMRFGWRTNSGGTDANGAGILLLYSNYAVIPERNVGVTKTVALYPLTSQKLSFAIINRSLGAFYLMRHEATGHWLLIWPSEQSSDATLFSEISNYDQTFTGPVETILQLSAPWNTDYGIAVARSQFTGANGTALASYTPDIGAAWVVQSGAAAIQGNAAQFSAAGIATQQTGKADLFWEAKIKTPSTWATAGGLILRWTDANNYWYVKFSDPTANPDVELIKVVGGVASTVASLDLTLVANTTYYIRVAFIGDQWFYIYTGTTQNYTQRIAYVTQDDFNRSATICGIRDEGNAQFTFDDVIAYPAGTGGEYDTPLVDPDYSADTGYFSLVVCSDIHGTAAASQIGPYALWAAQNKDALNIKAFISTGDLVTTGSVAAQFTKAGEAITALNNAGIPFSFSTGNHDYDDNTGASRTANNFNGVFTQAVYTGNAWFNGAFQGAVSENHYFTITVDGQVYLFISLEYGPRAAVVTWAKGIIDSNPNAKVFLFTHAFLRQAGTLFNTGDLYDPEPYPAYYNGQQLWNELVSLCPNVRWISCGHDHPSGTGSKWASNNGGIVNALFNGLSNSGFNLIKVYPALNQVEVVSYSLSSFFTDAAHAFTVALQ